MTAKKLLAHICLYAGTLLAYATPSQANFHLWDISELYSNADGTIQYVELFTSSDGQQVLMNHTIVASQGGMMHTFTFPSNSGTPTGNKRLLIATAGFASAPGGVTPDYVMDDGFLFTPDGMVNFGEGFSIESYATIPTDGVMSLHYPGGTVAANSPTNFAGAEGSLTGGMGPTPTPTETEVAPEPTATPTETEVAPEATATPTETEVAPEPTATPTETEVVPEPTATPTETEVAPEATATPTSTKSADLDGEDGVDPKDLFLFILQWMLDTTSAN